MTINKTEKTVSKGCAVHYISQHQKDLRRSQKISKDFQIYQNILQYFNTFQNIQTFSKMDYNNNKTSLQKAAQSWRSLKNHHDNLIMINVVSWLVQSIPFFTLPNLFIPNLTRERTLAYSNPKLGSDIPFFTLSNLFWPNLTRKPILIWSQGSFWNIKNLVVPSTKTVVTTTRMSRKFHETYQIPHRETTCP